MKTSMSPNAHKKPIATGSIKRDLRREFTMTNRNGLHARPCALLEKALRPFTCDALVKHGASSTNGRSIFGLMGLAVGYETKLTFVIRGSDAAPAMAAVQRLLFDTEFQEAYLPEDTEVAE